MKYTSFHVRQLDDRKGKPWQARLKYKDVNGKWKETAKMLPDATGKREATRQAKELFDKLNAEADLMPNVGKEKTIDQIYKEERMYLRELLQIYDLKSRYCRYQSFFWRT